MRIWGEHTLDGEKTSTWQIGDLDLQIKEAGNELWIASENSSMKKLPNDHEIKWSRWARRKSSNCIRLEPLFPDKAIVVKPESPFRLLPGVEARVFVRVPIYIGVKLKQKSDNYLAELPSVTLSLTWFGGPTEGELCYWISSSARREITSDSKRDYLAICPIQLKNSSDQDLLVEKLCLRVKWLSLYDKDDQLWANETKVSYKGGNDLSQVSIISGPPREAEKASMINAAREITRKSFSIRTFFGLGSDESVRGVEHN
jgi:hypothetical protein